MKRAFLSFSLFLLFAATLASQNSYSVKVDPLLRYQFHELMNQNKSKDSPQLLAKKVSNFSSIDIINDIAFTGIFIKTENIARTTSEIEKLGGWVTTVAGDIIVAKVPVQSINEIADIKEISRIEAGVNRSASLDKSRVDIKADLVQSGQGLSKPLKGKGVVVGVVDSGIDFNHDDFDDPNTGKTKIQYLWDVSDNGNPAQGFGYGHEYTKAQIDAGQCQQKDGNGHGTHVAGTAAGTGKAVSNYVGMAPEADIIFVKGTRDPNSQQGFQDVDVVNGCSYIFQKAASLSKPAVINLSLGGHFGAHDGASLYEESLSNLTGNGKIIVAAAGNQGDGDEYSGWPHVGYTASSTMQFTVLLLPDQSVQVIDLWFSSGNMEVGLGALDVNGNVLGSATCVVNGDSNLKSITYFDGSQTYKLGDVSIYTTDYDATHKAKRALIVMQNASSFGGLVTWVLATQAQSNVKFDAWFVSGGTFSDFDSPGFAVVKGDNISTIGIPGTAKKLISVGSHVTKDGWTDVNANSYSQGQLNNISSFSSRGPTRDNRIKPDFTAPGEVIVAAKTSQANVSAQNIVINTNGKLQKMQGTSMASPHVTGVVALMLQAKPTLNYDQILSILKQTTKKDAFVGSTPNNTWGSGKVNAYDACKQALLMSGIEYEDKSVLHSSNSTFYPNPASNWSAFEYYLPADSRVTLKVIDIFGRESATICDEYQTAGQKTINWNLQSKYGGKLTNGVYIYKLEYYSFGSKISDIQKFSIAE